MKFTVKNYRGIRDAKVEADKIAAVFGPNGAGKSSIAGAAIACLTGEPLPAGIKKGSAMKLVNDSARESTAVLESDTGMIAINLPDVTTKTTGSPACAGDYAVGKKNVLTISPKERDKLFTDLLKTSPTKNDLFDAVSHLISDGETIEQLFQQADKALLEAKRS